ncbi:hypothetical protein NIIDMKKI_23570 [Mycobacterium kansasii]|uniref:Uncharacterized protein n=1 Tax=Mycobacterium kansasii TaxID=1768 RepID=A0A7G1I7Y1_MYCKA|nr:hypothetical protein NIIDMKKI_23570 [Mycobacterium kansasii]
MLASTSLSGWVAPGSPAIDQAIHRASSFGYESWWQRCAAVGFAPTLFSPARMIPTSVGGWR